MGGAPQAKSENWVELRVHGVSGTPPESLLGVPHVQQVAGDDYSRFFRPDPEPAGHIVEAYHWGRFTSGTWRQGLSLLLMPFGLVNAAAYMVPARRRETNRAPGTQGHAAQILSSIGHSAVGTCLRGLALLMTMLFSFALGLIVIDLLAWRWSVRLGALDQHDATVMAGGVTVAGVAVVVLGFWGWSGRTRVPKLPPTARDPAWSHLSLRFYDITPSAWALRLLHIASGLGVIALLADLMRDQRTLGFSLLRTAWPGPSWAVALTMLAIWATVLLSGDIEGSASIASPGFVEGRRMVVLAVAIGLFVAMAGLLVDETVLTARSDIIRRPANDPSRLWAFDQVANGLMYVGVVILGALFVTVALYTWRGPAPWTRFDCGTRSVTAAALALTALSAASVTHGAWRLLAWVGVAIAACLLGWALLALRMPVRHATLTSTTSVPTQAGSPPSWWRLWAPSSRSASRRRPRRPSPPPWG